MYLHTAPRVQWKIEEPLSPYPAGLRPYTYHLEDIPQRVALPALLKAEPENDPPPDSYGFPVEGPSTTGTGPSGTGPTTSKPPAPTSKYEAAEGGAYSALFNPNTDALRLLRAVQIMKGVDRTLDAIERKTEGIEAGVAVHGRRVIAHIVMRELGDNFLQSPDSDLEPVLGGLEERVKSLLVKLVEHFPENSYPGNVFKNQVRSSELLQAAGLV